VGKTTVGIDPHVPVVVIFRGGIGALAIARTLGRLGVPMYLVQQQGFDTPVAFSRYWREKFLWDFSAPAEDSVRFLIDIARRIGTRPVLLTLADWVAIFIEQNAQALQEAFIFPKASPPLIRTLSNKWNLYQLAKQHGIPTPETVMPLSRADVIRYAENATFPVVLKSADAFVPNMPPKAIVYNKTELLEKYDAAAQAGSANYVLQEYIPGGDDSVWICNGYFGDGSECKAIFTGRKLRQVNRTGIASLGICVPVEPVERQSRFFMQVLGYEGALDVGYRYDARDGQYKVLDVNPRIGGCFRLFRATKGLDVVRVCYMHLTGQTIPPTEPSYGRKWMLEDDFFSAIEAMRARKLTLIGWIKSWWGVKETHWFAFDDPAPFAAWFAHTVWPVIVSVLQKFRNQSLGGKRYVGGGTTGDPTSSTTC
jgi:predicted ATP-grasp superfamily ATP-dependent carboligase